MNNTYFNSSTKKEEKSETVLDKLQEFTEDGWSFIKGYFKLNVSAVDFMKDVCNNINTFIDGYLKDNEELIAEFNEQYPELSILFKPVEGLMGISDGALKFAKDMTFGLGSDILGMLSYEYHGLLENPEETLSENLKALNMIRAIMCPMTKEEQELQSQALSGIWEEIKTSINTNLINGNPYTAGRFVSDVGLNIASLFFGAGELKAAGSVKKVDNVLDGVRVIDKVSDGTNFKVYLQFTEADRIKQFNLSNCRSIMKNELTAYRNKLIEDGHKDISKICSIIDAGNTSIRGKGGSGIWMYNPTIKDYRKINPKDFCKTPNDYTKYYRELLSDEYIKSLPDECFVKTSKVQVREEMSKLRHNINEVKKAARNDPDRPLNMFGEPSFEDRWNVENCAEVWAARDAIFKGAKFDDLVVRTENLIGGFAEPCENCLRTFFDFYNIDY